jgi:hypothetical protein
MIFPNNRVTQFLVPWSIEHNFLARKITSVSATDFAVSVSRPLGSSDSILYLVGM